MARVNAYIYHYGWVRPPHFMQKKRRVFEGIHQGQARAEEMLSKESTDFDFGNMSHLSVYRHTHPAVMDERIRLFNWGHRAAPVGHGVEFCTP
ncbi:hypothetical protein ACQ86N_01450 [Puia sp. P3]|uniref:hypothetical protein n=1 Tax=Puia sp. P3 TaxID=3423952 RepID=UPI003D67255F